MNRFLTWWIGPEAVLGLVTAGVFWYCARHASGAGRDVELLEKLLMLLPFVVVPLVFATILVPGARNWWWLGRAVTFAFLGLMICAGRIIGGFGTGAKGQDAAFILVMVFAIVLVSLAASVSGAMILAETRPAFAEWFRMRRLLGVLLVVIAAVPAGFILGVGLSLVLGVVGGIWSALQR